MSSAPTLSGFWACGEAITAIEKEWWAAAEQHTIKAEHKDTLASTRTILSTHQETPRERYRKINLVQSVVEKTESSFEDLKSKYFQWEKRVL